MSKRHCASTHHNTVSLQPSGGVLEERVLLVQRYMERIFLRSRIPRVNVRLLLGKRDLGTNLCRSFCKRYCLHSDFSNAVPSCLVGVSETPPGPSVEDPHADS